MTTPEATEVDIRVSEDGKVRPLRFRRGEIWMDIHQIGRSWSDEAGDHWLVMPMYPPRLYELIRTPSGVWQSAPHETSLA